MALGMPEFLRVRPEKYLKLGPDLSSSHWMQSFNEPSGLLKGSLVIQDQMQTPKQTSLVCAILYCHTLEHSSENPKSFRHLKTCSCPGNWNNILQSEWCIQFVLDGKYRRYFSRFTIVNCQAKNVHKLNSNRNLSFCITYEYLLLTTYVQYVTYLTPGR